MLILIRGLPGSGKSTIAKQLIGFKHYEADMFHMKNGIYCFDVANIKAAHNWCQNATYNSISKRENVVVSNTFTQKWELEPYLEMCAEFNIEANILIAKGNWENQHNVPQQVLQKMKNRWED